MTLWGSISFNLAVFINIIIAFFYPYVEGASTGQDGGQQAGASGPIWAEPGRVRCRVRRSTPALSSATHHILGRHRCAPVGQGLRPLGTAHTHAHTQFRDQLWW